MGNAKRLLQHVIQEIRETYTGEIEVEVEPRECSINREKLIRFYKRMGLKER